MPPAGEEQRFDFGDLPDGESRPPRRHETAEELVARVEAVHAAASRVRNRRRQVDDAVDEYLAAFPLDGLDDTSTAETESDDTSESVSRPHVAGAVRDIRLVGSDEEIPVAADVTVVTEREDGAPSIEPDAALTIAAFYERVRRALASEFDDEVWVTGEIRGLRESRGHRFLELADVGADTSGGRGAAQQLEVVCWAREWPAIGRQLAEAGVGLEVGRVVRVRGRVSVWEGASKLRFTLTALDVEALLGGIAAARRRLLLVLEAEGLLDKNRQHPIPLVPLRIGVVTSPGSEAHRDFVGQLERSGFAFDIHLQPSLVQGNDAPGQLVTALRAMEEYGPELCVLVRGGGARGDLAAFDSEEVARAIARAPFPIWAGIGHTGDHSVTDEVVHSAWITPTACGEAVVARVGTFWEDVERRAQTLVGLVRSRMRSALERLATIESGLGRAGRNQVDRRETELTVARAATVRVATTRLRSESERLARRSSELRRGLSRALAVANADVEHSSQVLGAFDPRRQFERGWSLTHRDGVLICSAADLAVGDEIVTRFADGETTSQVGERR